MRRVHVKLVYYTDLHDQSLIEAGPGGVFYPGNPLASRVWAGAKSSIASWNQSLDRDK
jgi:hypothetical protein